MPFTCMHSQVEKLKDNCVKNHFREMSPHLKHYTKNELIIALTCHHALLGFLKKLNTIIISKQI